MRPSEISKAFVRYYQERGFLLLPRASLLHPSIPMSFVMSAGLAQIEAASNELDRRDGSSYVLLQKCFRHFDLDAIGGDDIHLSLFEMPGAFSFGPDNKEKIIEWMWQFITGNLGIAQNRLWVTYFAGDEVSGHAVEKDRDTYQAWRQLGVPQEHLIGLGAADNFWKQGGGINDTGHDRECGPNSEVFFDHRPGLKCGSNCRPGCRCGRFVEFANSLFIDTEISDETGVLRPIATPFADTVIGAERVAMVLQGKRSVFEIESLSPIISAIRRFHKSDNSSDGGIVTGERVLADYLRALSFLVADGAPPPGKDGRERIVKILMRRVLTHQMVLGIQSSLFLPTILDLIIELNEDYPALADSRDTLLEYFAKESERFNRTLAKGQRQLEKLLRHNPGHVLTGKQIVSLEKEWGVPSKLVEMMLSQRELPFTRAEYEKALHEWKLSLNVSAS